MFTYLLSPCLLNILPWLYPELQFSNCLIRHCYFYNTGLYIFANLPQHWKQKQQSKLVLIFTSCPPTPISPLPPGATAAFLAPPPRYPLLISQSLRLWHPVLSQSTDSKGTSNQLPFVTWKTEQRKSSFFFLQHQNHI